jgi:hypothetical protein
VKACGGIVKAGPEDFQATLDAQEKPLVVVSEKSCSQVGRVYQQACFLDL